jgi:polysaccharide pyruvyl transferase WcaK-like protein
MWNETLDITRYDTLTRKAAALQERDTASGDTPGCARTGGAAAAGRRVLVRDGDSGHDLGDRAILHGLCESLRRADPDVRITIISARADVGHIPGVVQIIPRGLRGSLALLGAARAQELVIDAGRAAVVTPDPAFALTPAPDAAAERFLHSIWLDPHEPIIGVAVRGGIGRPGGILRRLRAWTGVGRDQDDVEIARVFDQIARAIETLARRANASVLLLPACHDGHEADSQYCYELAAMLELPSVRVAKLDDPRLYKAVCGRLKLMISARRHPLILAAGMGVPGIGLGHDGLFRGCFDLLGVPRRVIGLAEMRDGLQSESVVALADDALDDETDLQARSELVRRRVQQAVAALLHRSGPAPARPAPARPASPWRPAGGGRSQLQLR